MAQEPWLRQGSVRDNILLGKPLRVARYREVLRACDLAADLAKWPVQPLRILLNSYQDCHMVCLSG